MNKLKYYYTGEIVRNCKQNGEHGSLLFVYVDSWWAMFVSDRRQNKVQRDSTSAVLYKEYWPAQVQLWFSRFRERGSAYACPFGHVFNARKHQDDDDLNLSVEKHLSQKTLIGPGKLLGFSRNGPQGRGSLRYSLINRREGRHSGRYSFTKRFRKIPRISVGNVYRWRTCSI